MTRNDAYIHTNKFVTCTVSVSWQNRRHMQSLVAHGRCTCIYVPHSRV